MFLPGILGANKLELEHLMAMKKMKCIKEYFSHLCTGDINLAQERDCENQIGNIAKNSQALLLRLKSFWEVKWIGRTHHVTNTEGVDLHASCSAFNSRKSASLEGSASLRLCADLQSSIVRRVDRKRSSRKNHDCDKVLLENFRVSWLQNLSQAKGSLLMDDLWSRLGISSEDQHPSENWRFLKIILTFNFDVYLSPFGWNPFWANLSNAAS